MMNNFYRERQVLITGGLGFIGSQLARELVERGAHVTILDAVLPNYGGTLQNIASIRERITLHFADLRDGDMLGDALSDQSVIFCLAGQSSHIGSMRAPLDDLENNCAAQLSLLECCRRVNPKAKLVFTSTRQVYGKAKYLPIDENHPVAPTDINGIHKLAAEEYFRLYAQVYGMNTVTLRLTNTYGPHMDLDNPTKGFVGVFIRQALEGQKIRVFGDGSQRRDFNYVSDVVAALALAGECSDLGGQVFNLGHHENYSLIEFLEILATHWPVHYECEPFPDEMKRIDIGDYYGDYRRFNLQTGWRPRVDLAEGLERTVRFYCCANEFIA